MDTIRDNQILDELKRRLKPERLYHSICVAEQAKHLAAIYGADEDKAYTAGLAHDIMKYEDPQDALRMIEEDGKNKLSERDKRIIPTLHAVAGEVFLRTKMGITDEEILSAVRYHTTGRENMTLMEKIIYVSDLTGKDRDYPDVDDVRRAAETNIDMACLMGVKFTIEKNVLKNKTINIDTIKEYNYFAERIKDNG